MSAPSTPTRSVSEKVQFGALARAVSTTERCRNNFPISRRALAPIWMTQAGASALRLIAACFT